MEAFFEGLGRTVLERWRREKYSLAKFPQIARASLEERPPAKQVDLAAVMRGFLLSDEQPAQTDSDFGEPELVVYSHPRFYIQLLFWTDGTTAIHQHGFSGAFHVLHGSSIHARYGFDKARPVTPHLRVGNVRMKKIELLESGRTVPIVSGPRTIHSLFHLDSPSVTVVVRTQHDPGTGPQFNYLPPHVAIDPLHGDPLTARRMQLLDVLEHVDDPGYADLVTGMIAALDFERGFHVLRHCTGHLRRLGEWGAAIKAFRKRHGTLAAGVEATLREEGRRDAIRGLRSAITEPGHRFFLALLMNAPTRADLLTLVARRFPDEAAVAVVMRWVEELTEVSDEGVTILDASFPAAIDVEVEAQPELFLAAFRHFMERGKKLPPAMRRLSAANVRELRAAFAESPLGLLTA
jgi:predicted metal-dependent enzyme (double-stranded beta helix superfamily)